MSREAKVESLLKRGNYKYEYVAKVPFSQIDLKASEDNPARLKRNIDPLLVTKYGCEMLDGADFPAIVLLKQDRDKYLVATGMHRIKAALEAGRDWFDAFVVTEPDQFRADLLIRLLNGIEGRGDTIKEQLWHAIAMHEKYSKHSLAELAKAFSLNRTTVLNAWNDYQGVRRGARLGFDFENTQKLPQGVRIALNQIPSDLVYVRAAELVVHYDMPVPQVDEMVKELKNVRARGESAEIDVVKKYHDEAEEQMRRQKTRIGHTKPTASTRLLGTCKAMNKQIARGIEHLHLAALSNLDDANTIVDDAIDGLMKVRAEIQRIKRITSGGTRGGSGFPMAAKPH